MLKKYGMKEIQYINKFIAFLILILAFGCDGEKEKEIYPSKATVMMGEDCFGIEEIHRFVNGFCESIETKNKKELWKMHYLPIHAFTNWMDGRSGTNERIIRSYRDFTNNFDWIFPKQFIETVQKTKVVEYDIYCGPKHYGVSVNFKGFSVMITRFSIGTDLLISGMDYSTLQ